MLNKILLRKIKFPLSLRGAFSFCHSRERGNPSSLSLRGAFPHVIVRERSDRSNLNNKGFSLIELMVALAILAMVSFGIFQAFKTSFQGMVNSRERTIANNIAQKILEEVKSKNLEVGYSWSFDPETISGKEFTASVDIEEGPDPSITTLTKAIATVQWKDRNNKDKEITLETLVNTLTQKPEIDKATYILLSINPTSLILKEETEPAQITVTILDQDRYPINFDGQINLSVYPDLGNFNQTTLVFSSQTNQITTFTPEETGEAQIEAIDNANNLYPDAKTIKITREPAKIRLTAVPAVILIGTGQSIVKIEILDSEDQLVEFSGTVTITTLPEEISATLSLETVLFENEDTKNFTLFAGENAEEITIKANAQYEGEDLQEGSTTVRVSSGPEHLLLSSDRESIQNNGTDSAVLTVTVVDDHGDAVSLGTPGEPESIDLIINNSPHPACLFSPISPISFSGDSSKTINMTATSGTGEVVLIARHSTLGDSDEISIFITTGPPDYLEVVAEPDTIIADGLNTSTITITAKDENGYTTALGSIGSPVQVNISLNPEIGQIGEDNPEDYAISFSGQVSQTVTFTSTTAGTVTVTASSTGLDSGSDEITITAGEPVKIHLSATPLSITNDGEDESTITVTILDENDNATPYTGDIQLSLNPLDGGEIDTTEAQVSEISEGLYKISFTGGTSEVCHFTSAYGENVVVIISASDPLGELTDSNSVTVSVTSTSITVINVFFVSWYWWEYEYRIRFEFEVTGGEIPLGEMDIIWIQNPPTSQTRQLQSFQIWENSIDYWNTNRIYNNQSIYEYSPATGLEITEILYPSPTVTKYIGEMDFNYDMDTNQWEYTIIFKDNSIPKKEYPINFTFPE